MKLDRIVPFGRSLDEYRQMFNLSQEELAKRILGVGDGPASVNAELTRTGGMVISVDPLYACTGQEIGRQFYEVLDNVMEQVRETPSDWVWTYHDSPEDLRRHRIAALETFLADYEQGKRQHRYRIGQLPTLSGFEDTSFDLALCSHLLFLYSETFDLAFHQRALREMLRVAQECRIFPLVTLDHERSPHLEPVMHDLRTRGYEVEIANAGYELQRGGNEVLCIRNR